MAITTSTVKKKVTMLNSNSVFGIGKLFINNLGTKVVIVTKTSTNNLDTFYGTVLYEENGLLPNELNDEFLKKDYKQYFGELTLESTNI